MEQEYPRPQLGIKARPDVNKGTSVWDAMHPNTDVIGNPPPRTHSHMKPPTGKPEVMQYQRRDPIGYFESDPNPGGDNGEKRPVSNGNGNHVMGNGYQPSWNRQDSGSGDENGSGDNYVRANDLLENALRY